MDTKVIILSAVVACPVTAFIKYGFQYLMNRRTNIIVEESIKRILADEDFRQQLMEQVGEIIAKRLSFLIEVPNGHKE